MPSIQELQLPIDAAIVNAMIESTPENWQEIVLTLTRPPTETGVGNFSHELSSPEGHAPVGPADTLYDATYALDDLFQSVPGGRLVKAVYVAKAKQSGWSYESQFEYAQ